MRPLRATFTTLFALLGSLPCLRAQQPGASGESPLHEGTLPNGLHYAVLPHAAARGSVSVRLTVHAGSLDEHDDERGFAHFIEHMAFNGTRNFPANTVPIFFAQLGLKFGADLNAQTGFRDTNYFLDLPDGQAQHLDEALVFLRDVADGMLLEPDEVKKESAVVISELYARDNAGRRVGIDVLKAVYAGTRVAERDPTGVVAQLQTATADKLRAFYRRNYTPARCTLVIVGPVDPAALVQKITDAFGTLAAAPESAGMGPDVEPERFVGIKPHAVAEPTMKSATVELLSVTARSPDTPAGRREEMVQRVATDVLARRYELRRERNATDYSPPRVTFAPSPLADERVHHTIEIGTRASDWDDALGLIETELRRARTSITQAEVDEQVAGFLTSLRNRASSARGAAAADIAAELSTTLVAGRAWLSPTARFEEAKTALKGLTAEEVTRAIGAIFPDDAFQLIAVTPSDHTIKPEKLLAAYQKSVGRELKKNQVAEEGLQFRYENFGPPGKITKRERVADLDLTQIAFENGARINLRPSTFEPERFRLHVVFPLNLSYVPMNQGGIADLAGFLLLNSNLHLHKQTEIVRLLRLHGINPSFSVNNGTPALTISGASSELPFALRFFTALMSDLAFDDDYYRVALSRYAGLHLSLINSAGGLGLQEALRTFAGNDSRVIRNHPKLYSNNNSLRDTESWLRENILNAPFEIGLAGDFPVDDAIETAARTIGTLKRRKEPHPGAPLAVPTKATRQEATVPDLPASTAFSCVMWPIALPDDPKANAALELATDLLRDRLLLVVREAVGATYSPQTSVHRDLLQRDFAYAAMINTFDPTRARQLTEACVRLASRVAERGLPPEELDRFREPARARNTQDIRSNAWWARIGSLAQGRPSVLDEARHHEKIYDEITVADVNAAAQVFRAPNVTVVIVRPKVAQGSVTPAAPTNKKM